MGIHWLDGAIFVGLCLLAWALIALTVRLSHEGEEDR